MVLFFCPDGITPNSGLTGPNNTNIYIYIYIYIYIPVRKFYTQNIIEKTCFYNKITRYLYDLNFWLFHTENTRIVYLFVLFCFLLLLFIVVFFWGCIIENKWYIHIMYSVLHITYYTPYLSHGTYNPFPDIWNILPDHYKFLPGAWYLSPGI